MPQQVVLNLDQLDDIILGDSVPSFAGGMVSNDHANLLGEDQSSLLHNCDRSRIGKISTRKGTIQLGGGPPGTGPIIQGMAYYWKSGSAGYLVVASGRKLYKQVGASWVQIATGGILDNDSIDVVKTGRINKVAGHPVGDTVITVDGFVGPVANGDILVNWQRDKYTEYKITAHTETGGNVTEVTIGAPGLVVKAFDNDELKIKRLGAKVNNSGGYAGGTTTIAIDGITGAVANGDKFVVTGEEIVHNITGHSETGGDTTSLTFTPALQGQYLTATDTTPVIFALGGNKLYWTDGVGAIYSWDGSHTGNLANGNIYDYGGTDTAPTGVKWIAWFQNRLIAAGPASEPDAIWFSDFLDATRWDSNFQQLRVGGGESDPICVIVPWMDQNLVVFKEHAIYVINMDPSQNPDPADPTLLVASYGIKLLSHSVGCAAPQSVVTVGGQGGDIFFLGSDRQVRSLRRVVAAESQQEIGQAVSLPVQDWIDRVTTDFIDNTAAYYWNHRYMLALPVDGSEFPNVVMVYDSALQNWSGVWSGWKPTAFTTKLLGEGKQALAFGQSDNKVLQWLEDTGADELDPFTYKDDGVPIPTGILTRAFTFGDLFNWKTGLNIEFEFFDSLARITVSIRKDQDWSTGGPVGTFDTLTYDPLHLPFVIPVTLPTYTFRRIQKDLQRFGQFREIQVYIYSLEKKFTCRSIKLTGFLDSIQLQSQEDTPQLDSPAPPELIPFEL